MRIVSWMVVVGSISALSWLGLAPLLPRLELGDAHPDLAVGTTIANTVRAGVEVAQAELEERACESRRDGAAGRDTHRDPAHESARKKTAAKPACEE